MRKRWILASALFLLTLIITMPLLAQGDLTQKYTSGDGQLTFSYPDGWIAQDEGTFTSVYNNQNAADTGAFNAPHPGEAALQVIAPAKSGPGARLSGSTLEAAVKMLVRSFSLGSGKPGDMTSLTVGSYPAARAVISTAGDNDGVVIVIDLGGGQLVAGIGSAARGELANYEPTFQAIMASIQIAGASSGPVTGVSGEPPTATSNAPSNSNIQAITPQNAPQLAQLWSASVGDGCSNGGSFSADGKTVAVCSSGSDVFLLDAATGNQLQAVLGKAGGSYRVLFSADGQLLAAATANNSVYVLNVADGSDQSIRFGMNTFVADMAFKPDDSALVYITRDTASVRKVSLPDAIDSEITPLDGYNGTAIAYSPTDDIIMYGGTTLERSDVWLWDMAKNQQISTIELESGLLGLTFLPDGEAIALTVRGNDVQVWDIAVNKMLFDLAGHTDQVTSVALSADGSLLASGSNDQTVRLWDMQTGQQVASLSNDDSNLHLAFSPNGKMLLVSDQTGQVAVWGVR